MQLAVVAVATGGSHSTGTQVICGRAQLTLLAARPLIEGGQRIHSCCGERMPSALLLWRRQLLQREGRGALQGWKLCRRQVGGTG